MALFTICSFSADADEAPYTPKPLSQEEGLETRERVHSVQVRHHRKWRRNIGLSLWLIRNAHGGFVLAHKVLVKAGRLTFTFGEHVSRLASGIPSQPLYFGPAVTLCQTLDKWASWSENVSLCGIIFSWLKSPSAQCGPFLWASFLGVSNPSVSGKSP